MSQLKERVISFLDEKVEKRKAKEEAKKLFINQAVEAIKQHVNSNPKINWAAQLKHSPILMGEYAYAGNKKAINDLEQSFTERPQDFPLINIILNLTKTTNNEENTQIDFSRADLYFITKAIIEQLQNVIKPIGYEIVE